jgi:hypothetical protein
VVTRFVRVNGTVSAAIWDGAWGTRSTAIYAGFFSVLNAIGAGRCGRARGAGSTAVRPFFRHVLDTVFTGGREADLNHFVELLTLVAFIRVHLFDAAPFNAREAVGAGWNAPLRCVVWIDVGLFCWALIATSQEQKEERQYKQVSLHGIPQTRCATRT